MESADCGVVWVGRRVGGQFPPVAASRPQSRTDRDSDGQRPPSETGGADAARKIFCRAKKDRGGADGANSDQPQAGTGADTHLRTSLPGHYWRAVPADVRLSRTTPASGGCAPGAVSPRGQLPGLLNDRQGESTRVVRGEGETGGSLGSDP